MTKTTRRVGAVGLGLALVVGAGGIAAADPLGWYTGGNGSLADPDSTTTLKIVNASGTEITSGSINDPLGAFAVAAGTVRASDTSASLFVHLPARSTAPGAWSGAQTSATTKFAGSGAATAPSGASGKPFVSLTGSLPLTQSVAAFPNDETAASYADVYELRLRTSSATGGVSNEYASAFVKINGSSWAVTAAPDLGEEGGSRAATITPTWGGNIAYGAAANIAVTVKGGATAAKGSVVLKSGSTVVSQAARTLDAAGRATLTIPKGKLNPGRYALTVAFTTSSASVATSGVSAVRSVTVTKGNVAAPSFKVTKKITGKKAGALTVTVAKPAGLAQPTGKVDVVLKKGSKTVTIKNKTLNSKGLVKVAVPKQKAGKWTVTINYKGDARYNAKKSAAKKLTIAKK